MLVNDGDPPENLLESLSLCHVYYSKHNEYPNGCPELLNAFEYELA